jgi:hypothetical protein
LVGSLRRQALADPVVLVVRDTIVDGILDKTGKSQAETGGQLSLLLLSLCWACHQRISGVEIGEQTASRIDTSVSNLAFYHTLLEPASRVTKLL